MVAGATRTIRFDKDLDEALQTIGRHERMSVNSIVNHLVRKYVEWERYSEMFKMVEVSPRLLTEFMSRYSLDEARELGKTMSKDLMKASIESIFFEFTVDNAIEFFRRLSLYTGRFSFEEIAEGRKRVIVARHSMGLKWSAYYAGWIEEVFQRELGIKIQVDIGPETCSVKFELPAAGQD